ncbi:MAG: ATP-binding protein [Candidatus Eisenbacteria bacterium]
MTRHETDSEGVARMEGGGFRYPPPDGALRDSLETFSESLGALRETCADLGRRCADLDWALKESNRRLRESLEERRKLASRLDGILRCVPVGVVAADPEGRIIEFNRAAEKITGFAKEMVTGVPYEDLIGRRTGRRFGLLHTIETGNPIDGEEKRIAAADGRRIPVRYGTALVRGEEGEVLGAVEVFVDLRRTKLMEEELLRTRTLAAVGEMSAEVARQIRNPLAGVSGFAEILGRDLEGDPARAELVRKLREGVAGVERAVSRFLEGAGDGPARYRCLDVAAVVDKTLDLFEAGIEEAEGVRVERRIGRKEALAEIDEGQFSGALRRLLANARDAMPGGGVITVALDVVENPMDGGEEGDGGGEGAGSAGILDPESTVVVSVRDTGEGMTAEIRENAFSPFFSTRDRRVGLGLTMVRRTLTGHGGEAGLESEPGRGTTVVLRLPSARVSRMIAEARRTS